MGFTSIRMVCPDSDEPMLFKSIVECVKYFKDKKITTNGTKITGAHISKWVRKTPADVLKTGSREGRTHTNYGPPPGYRFLKSSK